MSSPDEDPVTFRAAFATPSHYKTNLSRASVAHSRLCSSRKPFQVKWTACTDERVPNSPNLLVNSWANSRKISSTVDLSRRFISVLFVSNRCRRAAYAEKQLLQIAEHYSISRRLLILSAGLHAKPGDIIPWRIISAAQKRQIDLTDERPCASFDISDSKLYLVSNSCEPYSCAEMRVTRIALLTLFTCFFLSATCYRLQSSTTTLLSLWIETSRTNCFIWQQHMPIYLAVTYTNGKERFGYFVISMQSCLILTTLEACHLMSPPLILQSKWALLWIL